MLLLIGQNQRSHYSRDPLAQARALASEFSCLRVLRTHQTAGDAAHKDLIGHLAARIFGRGQANVIISSHLGGRSDDTRAIVQKGA
jgi:hypothetical protein